MIKKYTLMAVGLSATGLGVVGVFVPLLPTVPFALLALYCFSLSSLRFQKGLLNSKLLGPILRNIKEKRGLSAREKAQILLTVWLSIGVTALWLLDDRPIAQVSLLAIALIETYIIIQYKTRRVD